MDVKSLHTNIPNQEGIDAVKSYLENSETFRSFHSWLILTLNNFTFNDRNYLQTAGPSMGTKCATNYANPFMGEFEETFLYLHLTNTSSLYLRYIDDIFMISKGIEEELKDFLTKINEAHPTDRNTFIHHNCYHPPATKKSTPYSQAMSPLRICPENEDYHNELEKLLKTFVEKGYEEGEIIEQFNKAYKIGSNS